MEFCGEVNRMDQSQPYLLLDCKRGCTLPHYYLLLGINEISQQVDGTVRNGVSPAMFGLIDVIFKTISVNSCSFNVIVLHPFHFDNLVLFLHNLRKIS